MENVTSKVLKTAVEKSGLSEYAIAKKIGITQQNLYRSKTTKYEANDDALIKLAQIAQLNPLEVLAEKHIQT
ncbi:MAG: hypothetical protein IBX55_18675, partial [Methyloprofundus sp.]|nr:hypothetical protein [Methyloprofundus sp.]